MGAIDMLARQDYSSVSPACLHVRHGGQLASTAPGHGSVEKGGYKR
jgi:hypothetical protein